MKTFLSILLVLATVSVYAQKGRVKPGQRYSPGDSIYAPYFGVKTQIPQGWEGVLPRETETFLLMPMEAYDASIYVWGTENDNIESLKKRWLAGVDMGSGIRLKAASPLRQRGQAWAAEGVLAGATNRDGRLVYAEAMCSTFGKCVTVILQSDKTSYDKAKKALMAMIDATQMSEPKIISLYDGFDWPEFLTGKVLMTYITNEGERALNEVHLCKDGTFQSNIKRKGLFKNDIKEYQGKKKGRWSVGKGQETTLVLEFEKAPRAEITLRIDNEMVYANGVRHYVGASEKCK